MSAGFVVSVVDGAAAPNRSAAAHKNPIAMTRPYLRSQLMRVSPCHYFAALARGGQSCPLFRDQLQQRMLRIGELRSPFLHELVFHLLLIDLGLNLVHDFRRRQFVDLSRVLLAE